MRRLLLSIWSHAALLRGLAMLAGRVRRYHPKRRLATVLALMAAGLIVGFPSTAHAADAPHLLMAEKMKTYLGLPGIAWGVIAVGLGLLVAYINRNNRSGS